MTIADNRAHRAAWLAKLARIRGEITDLHHEIDVAFQARPVPSVPTMRGLAESDTHLSVALVELDEAASRIP